MSQQHGNDHDLPPAWFLVHGFLCTAYRRRRGAAMKCVTRYNKKMKDE